MLLEFCAENFIKVPEAIKQGAKRIELCDNLAVGGTTPSYAVIEKTVKYSHANDAMVMTMIRPRGGDFVYSKEEVDMMLKDIEIAQALQSDGVVFGCLTKEKRIDRKQTKTLIEKAADLEVTFHMAYDEISHEYQLDDLEWLISQKVTRILTHGGLGGSVLDHRDWLNKTLTTASGRIEILIGGGVTHENLEEIAKAVPTNQFHGTKIVPLT